MERNQERTPLPAVGASSLLVIFAVLCLTVFALLGLSTVQADRRLSEASVRAVSSYYEADLQAESILAQLRQGEIPQAVSVDGNVYWYCCPISETQQLEVEVQLTGDEVEVLSWKAVPMVEEEEEFLDLWDGGIIF